jgi:hypothetical protein
MKCKSQNIIPKGFLIKTPFISRRSSRISYRASKALLRDRIHFHWSNNVAQLKKNLKNLGRWTQSKNTFILIIIFHRHNPTEVLLKSHLQFARLSLLTFSKHLINYDDPSYVTFFKIHSSVTFSFKCHELAYLGKLYSSNNQTYTHVKCIYLYIIFSHTSHRKLRIGKEVRTQQENSLSS